MGREEDPMKKLLCLLLAAAVSLQLLAVPVFAKKLTPEEKAAKRARQQLAVGLKILQAHTTDEDLRSQLQRLIRQIRQPLSCPPITDCPHP